MTKLNEKFLGFLLECTELAKRNGYEAFHEEGKIVIQIGSNGRAEEIPVKKTRRKIKKRNGRYFLDGDVLVAELKQAKRSTIDMADALGLHPSTLYGWIKGNNPVSIVDLRRMAKLLKITTSKLKKKVPSSVEKTNIQPG